MTHLTRDLGQLPDRIPCEKKATRYRVAKGNALSMSETFP